MRWRCRAPASMSIINQVTSYDKAHLKEDNRNSWSMGFGLTSVVLNCCMWINSDGRNGSFTDTKRGDWQLPHCTADCQSTSDRSFHQHFRIDVRPDSDVTSCLQFSTFKIKGMLDKLASQQIVVPKKMLPRLEKRVKSSYFSLYYYNVSLI